MGDPTVDTGHERVSSTLKVFNSHACPTASIVGHIPVQ